jgi:hypothetical protein
MKFDYEIQNRLFVCLITAFLILSGIVIYQSYEIQTLQSLSSDIINSRTGLELSLINHLDCNELQDWKNILSSETTKTPLLNTLSNAIDKAFINKFCSVY